MICTNVSFTQLFFIIFLSYALCQIVDELLDIFFNWLSRDKKEVKEDESNR